MLFCNRAQYLRSFGLFFRHFSWLPTRSKLFTLRLEVFELLNRNRGKLGNQGFFTAQRQGETLTDLLLAFESTATDHIPWSDGQAKGLAHTKNLDLHVTSGLWKTAE